MADQADRQEEIRRKLEQEQPNRTGKENPYRSEARPDPNHGADWGQAGQGGKDDEWGNEGNAGNEGYFQGFEGTDESFGGHGSQHTRLVLEKDWSLPQRANPAVARPANPADERIWQAVTDQLNGNPDIRPQNLDVTVQEGQVILAGTVASTGASRLAADTTESVEGVKGVRNDLRVEPS
jgi:hypothetical protein